MSVHTHLRGFQEGVCVVLVSGLGRGPELLNERFRHRLLCLPEVLLGPIGYISVRGAVICSESRLSSPEFNPRAGLAAYLAFAWRVGA